MALYHSIHYYRYYKSLFLGREKVCELLIEKGASIDPVDNEGNSALLLAIDKGN